jgi:hypothetical protein
MFESLNVFHSASKGGLMKRIRLLALILVTSILVLGTLAGCSSSKNTTPTGKYEILRRAILGNTWQMYQIRVVLESGSDFDIDLLGLMGTDKVDGYFYPEKGIGATVTIMSGATVIYKADSSSVALGGTLSDRFSFPADQPSGTAYVLQFHNGGTDTVNIFVELIYPKTGQIRGPIDLK